MNEPLNAKEISAIVAVAKSVPGTAGQQATAAQVAAEAARDEAVAAAEIATAHSIALELTQNEDGTYNLECIPATGSNDS